MLYCIEKNVLLKFTVSSRKFKIAYVAYIILDMYWTLFICSVQFVWTLPFAVGVVQLEFIDIPVCFSLARDYGFHCIFKGTHDQSKGRNCCRNWRQLVIVAACSYLGTASGLDLGESLTGRLGKTCSTRGIVRCILGFSGWNSGCSHRNVFIERH